MSEALSLGNVCIENRCCACCVGVRILLTLEEAQFLRSKGTTLIAPRRVGDKPNNLRSNGKAYFDMEGRCGLLSTEGLCGVYETGNRPVACKSLQPRSNDCSDLRNDQGLQPIVLFYEGTK